VVKKGSQAPLEPESLVEDEEAAAEKEEDFFSNIESVSGRLVSTSARVAPPSGLIWA